MIARTASLPRSIDGLGHLHIIVGAQPGEGLVALLRRDMKKIGVCRSRAIDDGGVGNPQG
jgi:hypothetical protein